MGTDTVRGWDNTPPYSYALSGLSTAETAIVSAAGIDGNDGGWPVLYGTNPVSPSALQLVIDEDQVGDAEQSHTTEQVAYLVFEATVP